jgi:AraC-like DNA-binding protein
MRYFIFETDTPVRYLSCGQLYNKKGFLHEKRTINSTVFIYVNEGSLYIAQETHNYEIKKNQFIILHENDIHWGWKKSELVLSYYWVHFQLPSGTETTYDHQKIESFINLHKEQEMNQNDFYILPETGTGDPDGRLPLLFRQLLDYGCERCENVWNLRRYSLSLLLGELTREVIFSIAHKMVYKPLIIRIQNWVHNNYRNHLSVKKIAARFHYNSDYLSSEFKKQTGVTLSQYINKIRIEQAKKLLTINNMSVKNTAYASGFTNEKYFMKVFKSLENITPLSYKQAFFRKKILSGR